MGQSDSLFDDIFNNQLTPHSFEVYDTMPPWNQGVSQAAITLFNDVERAGLAPKSLAKREVREAIAMLCALLPWPYLTRLDALVTPLVPAYLRSTQPTLSDEQIDASDMLRVFLPDAKPSLIPIYKQRIEQLDRVETINGLLPWLRTDPIKTLCTPGIGS